MRTEPFAHGGGAEPTRATRWSIGTPQALVIGAAMAFDMMLMIRGIHPWPAVLNTLSLVAGLMLVTTGRITWMRSALARVFSTDAPQMPTGPAGPVQGGPPDPGLPTIGDGRRL